MKENNYKAGDIVIRDVPDFLAEQFQSAQDTKIAGEWLLRKGVREEQATWGAIKKRYNLQTDKYAYGFNPSSRTIEVLHELNKEGKP